MEDEKKLQEPSAAYAALPTLDLSRMPDIPSDEVEADITAAFEEMKAERYGVRSA